MKLLTILLAFVLLTSFASAWDWDNVKDYDRNTGIITIRDSLLGIPTTKIAEAKLETPQVNFVPANSYTIPVAAFWINLSDTEYKDWIAKIETYNLNDNWKEINKTFIVKKRSFELKLTPLYQIVCRNYTIQGKLQEVCQSEFDRNALRLQEVWTPIENATLRNGWNYIGLFTEVKVNEKVEWIPTIMGVRINEWAAWDSSLNVGLRANYHFDEANGTAGAKDSLGALNFTGTVGRTTNGKIYNATYGDAAGTAKLTRTGLIGSTDSITINAWVKLPPSSCPSCSGIVFGGNNNVSWFGDGSCLGNIGLSRYYFNSVCTNFGRLDNNTWHMVTMTCVSGGTKYIYVNGVLNATDAGGCNPFSNISESYNVNRYALGTEYGDELSIWNRTLSAGEVTQLYTDQLANKTYDVTPSIPSGSIAITLNDPANNIKTNNTVSITFNYTIIPSDVNVTNSTVFFANRDVPAVNGSIFNNSYALTNATQTYYATWSGGLVPGNYTWNVRGCYINLTYGHACTNSSNYTFIVDTTAPRIVITHPNGTYLSSTVPLNYSITETYPGSCYYNSSENAITTVLANCANTTVTFASPGYKTIFVYANDSAGNLNKTSKTFAIDTIQTSYNNNTYETKEENFGVSYSNISGVPISAILTYDGVDYTTTSDSVGSGNYVSNKTLDISLTNVTINKSFYWTINYFGGSSASTSMANQTVNPIQLQQCNATYTQQTINYTVYDETTLAKINNFALYGTINYWLGSGAYYKILSIANPYVNYTTLCISPTFETFTANGIIQYGDNNLSYTTRNEYLVEKILTNASENKLLYLLDNDDSTTFILKVQDFTQTPVVGAYIVIQRYYPGTNSYATVQVAQTDQNGETLGFLKTETVEYRFIINNASGYNLKITDKAVVFGKTTPYTLIFTVGDLIGIPWEEFEDRRGLNTSLTYNNNTKTVGYVYVDTNSSFTSARLYVEKINPSGQPDLICNETSSSSSNLLTCDLSAYNESSFKAVGFNTRFVSGLNNEVATNVIIIQIDDIIETFGEEGLFWAFVIILTSALTMLYNPIAGMWVVTAATIFVRVIGIAKFGMVWIFGLITLSIIFSILFKPRGGFQ